jgi:hypothetical protein
LNFSSAKKILIILFLLSLFSVNANALAGISISCPSELLIQKGWTNFISFSVNNSGDTNLSNINVSIEGDFPNWFEFQNSKIIALEINKEVDLVAKVSIPLDIAIGNYKFSFNAKSNDVSGKKDFTVRVFESRDDLLLYQIQSLRANLSELEKEADAIESTGKNLTSTRSLFYQINSELNMAQDQVNNKQYTQETETIRDVEKLFIEAIFDVSNPPGPIETKSNQNFDISSKDVFFTSLGIGIIVLLAALIYLVKKIKIKNKVRLPNLRLKELIVENNRLKALEWEIEKIEDAQNIIEEESKESTISKESYEELRLKYQEKLLELEGERRKVRGY